MSTASGELVVVPSVVQQGETVLAVGFHVVPADLDVVIQYSEHFTPEDEACDTAGIAGSAEAATAPVWVTLNACTVGDGYVRLVEATTGNVVKDVSVRIDPPGATGQATTISINGLTTEELVPESSEDELLVTDQFSVIVNNLDSNIDHKLHTVVLNNLSAAFNQDCTRFRATTDIVSVPSVTQLYTVYGCVAPGNRLWSYVQEVNGRILVSTGIHDNPVNVKAPTVSFEHPEYSVVEGGEVDVNVELRHSSSYFIRVPIEASGGTAESTDYELRGLTPDGRLSFSNHSKSEPVTFVAKEDDDCDDETVNLSFGTLPSTVSGTGKYPSATVTIRDNDECVVSFRSNSYTVDEGTHVTVEVELSRTSERTLNIPIRVMRGTAESGDYSVHGLISGRLRFTAGTPRASFTIRAEEDDDFDDETVNLSFGTLPSGVNEGAPSSARLTIVDNDLEVIGPSSVRYSECLAATVVVGSYSVSDPGGGDISWSLPNTTFETDRFDFSISSGGELRFRRTPNFESPHDSNRDNVYRVTVEASDDNLTATKNVTVRNIAPRITSGQDSLDYAEGQTDPLVGRYRASDPCGGDISWSLTGADQGDLNITMLGDLTFNSPPNFESPDDSDRDNVYQVTVMASDGRLTDSRNVVVTITDVDEAPDTPSAPNVTAAGQTSLNVEWSAPTNTGPPIDDYDVQYRIGSSGPFTNFDHTGIATRTTITDLAAGTAYEVQVRAWNAEGMSDWSESGPGSTDAAVTIGKVTGLVGTPGSTRGTIDLDWNPATGADGYEVAEWRRRFPGVFHWVILEASEVTIDLGNTSAVVRGLEGRETYRHRVRGIRGTGSNRVEGEWSEHVDTTLIPEKVTGISGMPGAAHGEIVLDWDAAADATGYQVQQRKPRPFPLPDDWILLPAEGIGVVISGTTAVVTNLDPDKTYVYQVRGTNVHGEGQWSDATPEISVRDERPNKPVILKTDDMVGGRGVELEWQAVAEASGYEVEIDPQPSLDLVLIDPKGPSATIRGLTPGTDYAFQVRAWKTYRGSRLYSLWSDPVNHLAPMPTNSGHQADHVVKYEVGTIGNSVIEDAIAPAVSAWNSKMAGLGKGLEICSGSGCSNPDGFTATIKTVDNNNDAITHSGEFDEGCGPARACVKSFKGDHKTEMHMIFEDPPWYADDTEANVWRLKLYVWTKDSSKNGHRVPCLPTPTSCNMMTPRYYVYVDRIMLHEFGHTLGLPEFYDDKAEAARLDGFQHAVMYTGDVIHDEDINQLRAIYLLHNPH